MSTSTSQTARTPLIFISAAEPSADLHGASLIRATRAVCPEAQFVGIAGPRMAEAGCKVLFDMSRHSAMLLGALKAAGQAIRMLKTAGENLRMCPYDAAVVIDSPTLHLPLAGHAQAAGVPVLYYIAPQLWAWGTYRTHKLRNRVERVAAILPFEEEFFRNHGINARYVGHPLAEQWSGQAIDAAAVGQIRSNGDQVVALLPGSRKHVVGEVLPGQLEVAAKIAAVIPRVHFGVSVANDQVAPLITDLIESSPAAARPYRGQHAELIQAADLVLVASGTTTLEVAFHARPMMVMYNASRVFYHLIARWMIHTSHLSLPNILAEREIVPEFMPYYTSAGPIAERAIELLRSETLRERMIHDLNEVVEPLRNTRASHRTAEMLLDMISAGRH